MSYDLPNDWYIEPTGESLILDQEKVAAEIERLRAALTQIRGFAEVMQENNWRDLRLHIQRQCDVLNEQLQDPPKRCWL